MTPYYTLCDDVCMTTTAVHADLYQHLVAEHRIFAPAYTAERWAASSMTTYLFAALRVMGMSR